MTPSCPNCGETYREGEPDDAGWRTVSIATSHIFEDKLDGTPPFFGVEYWCAKCDHHWRVAAKPDEARPF